MTRRTPVRCAAIAIRREAGAFAPTSGADPHIGCCEARCVDDDLCAYEGFARESMMASSWSASSMMLSTSRRGLQSRGASMGSTLLPSASARDRREPTKPLANDFPHWIRTSLLPLSRARVRCGEKWGSFNFPIFDQFMGNLWVLFVSGRFFARGAQRKHRL